MGYFTMELQGYEEVPSHEAQKVLHQRDEEKHKDDPIVNHPKGRA